MCARRKPERKDARLGITEGWYGSSPVLPIGIGAPTHTRDLSAMRSQAWTPLAGDDLYIQSYERFRGSGHACY